MVVAVLASACGASTKPSASSDTPATSTAPGSSGAATGPKVEVTFWQHQFEDYQQAWFKKEVAAFNAAHPAIEVKYTVVPADAWDAKIKAAQAAGKAPDILTTNYGGIKPGIVNGQFAKLDGLIKPEAFADIADNVKGFVSAKDGGYYAYPMLVEPSTVLYYRKDLFTAAGLDPAKPPTTWDELISDARALTKGGVYGMNIAQTAPDLGWSSWGLQYNAAGHLPIADDWSAPKATDPAYKKLLQLYQTLYTQKLMPPEATFPYADVSFYGQGKVAMTAGGSWEIGQLSADFKQTLANTAVAAFPSVDGDATKPTATLGGWTLTVDAKSKVQQQAADFVSWLLAGDPAIMTDFFKTAGYSKYSPRASVAAALAADPDASSNPYLAIVSKDVLPFAKAEPAYPFDVSLAFSTAIEKAMKGSDIDAALGEADKAIADVIAKQKLAGTAP
ncbi:MAG: sugar ABC transporter substrate-binding protein [Chloroflexi bacterium]|nr:sugar ABC transporter substrate-binding protein [Chloroflexota bacterium]